MKRLFSLALGLGTGLLVGASVMRRIDAARQAVAPDNLAGRAGRAAGSLTDRLRVAAAEGRAAADEQEQILRERYQVPRLRDALEQDEPR